MKDLIEQLEYFDQQLFLFLNQLHHPALDFIMYWASDKFIWFPFYGLLLFFIIRRYKWDSIPVILGIALLVTLTDQTASGFMKPFFERLRPCHNPEIRDQIHMVAGCGGRFGFASSHASNVFGIAMFLWLLFRRISAYVWLMFIWAAIVSYSRIYLGVHYPADILTGALIGLFFGWLIYFLLELTLPSYRKLRRFMN